MAVTSQSLQREIKPEVDLTVFGPADLDTARARWLLLLHERMQALDNARSDVRNEFDYGGAAAVCGMHAGLEEEVDEARRMVYALSTEMRRRSEGELPVWKEDTPPTTTIILGGMVKATSCE